MSDTTELMYNLLGDEDRAKMVHNAILQLEQQRFEAEINLTIIGPEKQMAPEGLTAPQKMIKIDEQIARLKEHYGELLQLLG